MARARKRKLTAAQRALIEGTPGVVDYARRVAARVARGLNLPPHEAEELEAAGLYGLVTAALTFDRRKGAAFKTHAGHRVRGACLDHVRRHAPAGSRRRSVAAAQLSQLGPAGGRFWYAPRERGDEPRDEANGRLAAWGRCRRFRLRLGPLARVVAYLRFVERWRVPEIERGVGVTNRQAYLLLAEFRGGVAAAREEFA